MNKPLISTGIALSAIGLLAVAPAQAGTLTFDFQVDATSMVTVNPFFSGMALGGQTVPNSIDAMADSVAGRFTVLDDPAQFTDGSVDLGSDFLDDVLGSSYSAMVEALLGDYGFTSTQDVVQSADDLFNISQFTGGGVLESKAFPFTPSSFNIGYDSTTNAAVIDGYSTEVAESCLSTTCLFDGNVSFGVSLVLSEFVTVTSDLLANSTVPLTSEATDAIANLQQLATLAQFFGPTLSLGTVATGFSAITDLASSDPTGTDLGFDVTDGLVTATTTTGTQVEQIVSQSLAVAPVPEVAPALVPEVVPAVVPAVVPEVVTELAVEPAPPIVVEPPLLLSETPTVTESLAVSEPLVVSELPPVPEPSVSEPSVPEPPAAIVKPLVVASSSAPSPITLVTASANGSTDSQDVPEPSILMGLLGTAALLKRGRKKTSAPKNQSSLEG